MADVHAPVVATALDQSKTPSPVKSSPFTIRKKAKPETHRAIHLAGGPAKSKAGTSIFPCSFLIQ